MCHEGNAHSQAPRVSQQLHPPQEQDASDDIEEDKELITGTAACMQTHVDANVDT